MKKILMAILTIILSLSAIVTVASPAYAYDYPSPPASPDMSWQPPYWGEMSMDPLVGVEIYHQTWPTLQIPYPSAVAPGIPSSIINAYLVNNYGQILTNLYRNGECYLIASFNGPGYFYLWEYYPYGTAPYGHWLCYRWYCPNAGIWRIGPFTAEPADPAGKYTWKMWFLSGVSCSTRLMSFNFIRDYYPPDIPEPMPSPNYLPTVESFSVNKSSIEEGETAILTWTTTNANSVTISPGIGTVAASGSTSVTPTSTTAYTLVAENRLGNTASSTTTITVMPRVAPEINIDKASIQKGQSTFLSWNAPGALYVSIDNLGNVSTNGTMQISPEKTTTYTLTASYTDGTSQSAFVTINVEELPYLLWGLIFLLIVAVILIALLVVRKRSKSHSAPEAKTQAAYTTKQSEATNYSDNLPATTPVMVDASAKLVMPNGKDILLAGNARSLGRNDFEKFMLPDDIPYISRQHINIWYEDGQYYVEDRGSTNGTKINGINIKSTGRNSLNDGDVIEIAGKLSITFKENI